MCGVVLRQGDVADLDVLVGPLVEQLDTANLLDDVLGQDLVARDGLDLDLSVVRHAGHKLLNRIDETGGLGVVEKGRDPSLAVGESGWVGWLSRMGEDQDLFFVWLCAVVVVSGRAVGA